MTDTTHTPGPWQIWGQITGISRSPCTGHTISKGPNIFICDAIGTSDANARLIAAAPELLAACQRALVEAVADDQDEWFAIMRAAIAKATGVQS